MPRSFDMSFDSSASVEQVHSAFGEEDYWLARIDAFGGAKTLSSLVVESDGTVTVTITEDLRHGVLPGVLAKLNRGDLNVVSTERWRPAGDRRVSGEISVAAIGAPGSGYGAAMLSPSPGGSQLTLSVTVEFKVPLVGSRIETHVAEQFADGLDQIQRFTTTWIGEHA
ncbi:DUF2505 domain-containing protein [Mycolicibacterium mengxianglii]|uniref:DUF2505 domain-containing protein n=1 Tax=Mycolicibacterium mengxianglii TaxID=2736649 RepID=UPI0018D1AC71|nr:DUF2505 domain-containing protein [Mycolicibacterium mengxianglii]